MCGVFLLATRPCRTVGQYVAPTTVTMSSFPMARWNKGRVRRLRILTARSKVGKTPTYTFLSINSQFELLRFCLNDYQLIQVTNTKQYWEGATADLYLTTFIYMHVRICIKQLKNVKTTTKGHQSV